MDKKNFVVQSLFYQEDYCKSLREIKEQKIQKLNENVSTLMESEISDVTVARTLELIHLDKELEEMQK